MRAGACVEQRRARCVGRRGATWRSAAWAAAWRGRGAACAAARHVAARAASLALRLRVRNL
eukprot:482733-Prymnesium_polylepis.1